jgi:bleomycin hydrolase
MRRLNISVKPAFELSEAYLFFYDKLERANHFLQRVQDMRDKPDTDIDVITMFTSRPTDDGGTFGYFRNLTEKYGIVPKSCYGEGFNTRYTAEMNDLLWQKLAEFAWTIRNREEADIEAMLAVIYNMLVKFMGEPPTTFTWKYYESSTDHKSHGLSHMIKDLTPQSFYADYIQPDYDVSRMVLLRHDPRERHPYFQTYACRDVTNMVNAPASIYFNVPIEVMRKATANSILHGTPVWFACDVQKDYNQEHSLLSTEAYDYGELMGTRFDMTKAQMLETYSSYPTHAMLLVGLDKDDKDDTINRWRVENSWGEVGTGEGEERGYLQMSDGWFAKYVYECVVDISYLPDDVADIYRDREYEPTWIDIRDPLALSSIKK